MTASATLAGPSAAPAESIQPSTVHYHTIRIDDVDIFYREAGRKVRSCSASPARIPNIVEHVPQPDTSPCGLISRDRSRLSRLWFQRMPDRKNFAYTFENMTNIVEKLTEKLELSKYSMYVMDYGAPIGYRLALRHPERVTGFIVQNGNAYEEGLLEFWDPIKKYWNDATTENRAALNFLATADATKWQYQNGVKDLTLLDPTTWTLDQLGMDRPGNADIQLDMLYDYRTNVPFYPDFQEFFRKYQPPMLIVWGKNDHIFPPEGAAQYKRDLPKVETHLIDTGHFALETHGEEIASRIEEFFFPRR